MNFNDIKERLERTLSSLNSRFSYEIGKSIKIENRKEGESMTLTVNFGGDDVHEIENKIFIILHNLVNLKNCIKNSMEKPGRDKAAIENAINQSIYLQVLVDLVNQEKHGYPLTKNNRSKKNPVIKDISQGLRLSSANGRPASFTMDPFSGAFHSEGDNAIVIHGKIYDDKDTFLFSVDELVEKSFESLQEIAINNKLIEAKS